VESQSTRQERLKKDLTDKRGQVFGYQRGEKTFYVVAWNISWPG
jgi:hypothetical protein